MGPKAPGTTGPEVPGTTGPEAPGTIEIAETAVTLAPSDTATLRAMISGNGKIFESPPVNYPPPSESVQWSSASQGIASVGASGFVTAGSSGSTWIRVSNSSSTDSAFVRVRAGAAVAAWQQVAVGQDFTCGLLTSGAAYCWGGNIRGVLGVGTRRQFTATLSPVQAIPNGPFKAIAAGIAFACAIRVAGSVWCWGSIPGPDLFPEPQTSPAEVANTGDIAVVSIGLGHACGLDSQGRALCWGGNGAGQLGTGTKLAAGAAQMVVTDKRFVSVSAGGTHTCAVDTDNLAWCWGSNTGYQVGVSGSTVPVRVGTTEKFEMLSAGSHHTCGLTLDRRIVCWGFNSDGQLGSSDMAQQGPIPIAGLPSVVSVSAGQAHTCALTSDAAAYCWGVNYQGQLGNGVAAGSNISPPAENPYRVLTPVAVVGRIRFRSVAASLGRHSCGVSESGRLFCWGDNERGQLGSGARRLPVGRDFFVKNVFSSQPLVVVDP